MDEKKDKHSLISKINGSLLPIEKIFLLYLLITLLIILIGYSKTQNSHYLLLARLFSLILVFFSVRFKINRKGFFRNFYILALTAWFYGETGYFNNTFFNDLDYILVKLEEWIFSGHPSILFSSKYNFIWLSEFMNFGYFSFYLITFGFPLFFYLKKDPNFQFVIFIILNSFFCYYLLFVIFPSVGPQFWFKENNFQENKVGVFTFIVSSIQKFGETPTGAFPSSHNGVSWLIVFLASKFYKFLLYILIPVAMLLTASTVYIKAHYVVDIIGGLLSIPLLYFFSKKLFYKFTNRRIIKYS